MKHWSESTDWRILSHAVHTLRLKVEASYYACEDEEAGSAHDDLVSAEWRLRQAKRRSVNE